MAAHWWGKDPEQWAALDGSMQSLMVAAYEAHNVIESISAEAANKKGQEPGQRNRPRTAASAAAQFNEDS